MTIEEARDIVRACTAHTMYMMGVADEQPPSLEGYTLRQLLDANDMVKEADRNQSGDGPRTMQVVCADRLIAALYTAYHYPGDSPESIEPIAHAPGRVVAVIRANTDPCREEEEDAADLEKVA